MRIASFLFFLFAISNGYAQQLTVYTDYIGRETLASFQMGTPDPLLIHPPTGQRLIVKWSLPRSYLELENLHLEIALRFRDRTLTNLNLPICQKRGSHIYTVLGKNYLQTGGILTYQVKILSSDQTLETWTHPLWAPIIGDILVGVVLP